MKAIVALTKEEYQKYEEQYAQLREATKGFDKYDLFEKLEHRRGHAEYKFSGEVTDTLTELLGRMPTSEEIIMLVDGGFSHFGASCGLNGKVFNGTVYVD